MFTERYNRYQTQSELYITFIGTRTIDAQQYYQRNRIKLPLLSFIWELISRFVPYFDGIFPRRTNYQWTDEFAIYFLEYLTFCI